MKKLYIYILLLIAPLVKSQSDAKTDYYFFDTNQIPSNFTSFSNVVPTVSGGTLDLNIHDTNASWKVSYQLSINKPIMDCPYLVFSYKVGNPAPGKKAGTSYVMWINGKRKEALDNWRIYLNLDASKSDWQRAFVDLTPLIENWKANYPGEPFLNIEKLQINIGTSTPFSGYLSFDSIAVGNYFRIKKYALNPTNSREVDILFSRPVKEIKSICGLSILNNGSRVGVSDFSQPTDTTFKMILAMPILPSPLRPTKKPVLNYVLSSGLIADKVNSTLPLMVATDQSMEFDDYLYTTFYPHWGRYQNPDLSTIRVQPWETADRIVEGWDWSLPPSLKPSPRSMFILKRTGSMTSNDIRDASTINFPCNAVFTHWINWKEIEPIQGTFRFDLLLDRINAAAAKGYKSKIRLHFSRKSYAPDWVNAKTNLNLMPAIEYSDPTYDPTDPDFHLLYKAAIAGFGASGLAANPNVVAIYLGWRSPSHGDEGHCPCNGDEGDSNPNVETSEEKIGRERIDAWAAAVGSNAHKVMMGGDTDYGFSKGFGLRAGFVEHYLYRLPTKAIGQTIVNNYVEVDETAPVLKQQLINSEENEEYGLPSIEDFGYLAGFPYRFFASCLRMLQMRCTGALMPTAVIPELFAYMGNAFGRTPNDAPDAWCWLRQNNIYTYGDIKNFEHLLYQRDAIGYATTPTFRVEHASSEWMCTNNNKFDYIARKGQKIGFDLDQRFLPEGGNSVAVKISYLDIPGGELELVFKNGNQIEERRTIAITGTNTVKTATFFIRAYLYDMKGKYDFELHSSTTDSKQVPVVLLRVVKPDSFYSGIEAVSNDRGQRLDLFPNPVEDWLTVVSTIDGELSIVDSRGSVVLQTTISGQRSVPLAELSAGIYFVKVKGTADMEVRRFVKR